jgi:hypothetical protein
LVTLKNCFLASPYIQSSNNISLHENLSDEPLPIIFNRYVESYLKNNKDCWLVFCHQDFILNEDLRLIIKNKNTNAIYGVIGGRTSTSNLFGRIMQRDGSFIGDSIDVDTPVQTLDELCLIVHSSLFRKGLRFDERFEFHFYGADLCMQAYKLGFDVYAVQVSCQHKSRTIAGDVTSAEYCRQLKLFANKWHRHLPIKTSTKLVTEACL